MDYDYTQTPQQLQASGHVAAPQSATNKTPKPKKQSGKGRTLHHHAAPHTPPRASNHREAVSDVEGYLSPSTNPNNQSMRQKKRGNKNYQSTGKQKGAPAQQPTPSATPAKAAQIYAGPTFHASPAASALPIPKFFSQSLPNKEPILSQAKEDSESSSAEGEGSPSVRSAAVKQAAREESPLDFFFRADRQEKARRKLTPNDASLNTPGYENTPGSGRANSTSPSPEFMRSQVPNSDSMFAMDMERPGSGANSFRSYSPSVAEDRAAEARAKTEALKQLLLFQKPQNGTESPHNRSSSSLPNFSHDYASHERPSSNRENFAQQFVSPPASSSSHNQRFSQGRSSLRQEMRPATVGDTSSPTPVRSHNFMDGQPKFQREDALRATFGGNQTSENSTEMMEAELRRVLKLDNLSSTGVR